MASTPSYNAGFWEHLPKPFSVLAPMAEVTDIPFRRIVAECGRPDVFYSEFVSAAGLTSAGHDRLIKDLSFLPGEKPIVAQFFGSDPKQFNACAIIARDMGFDGIDINMGCPDRKVLKQGGGIALCKTPELAKEIITATKEGAGNLPVSVKTRIGYHSIDIESWIGALLACDIPALAVHLRTMKEMSKVPAHWELMPQIVEMAKPYGTLIIGNGDIMSHADMMEKHRMTGVHGVMVGRGIFHNPWLFNPTVDQLAITPKARLELLIRHTEYFEEFWGDLKSFNVLKRFYKVYVSNWDGAKDLRVQLMETKNTADVRAIVEPYLATL